MNFLHKAAHALLLLGIALYLGGMVALGAVAAPSLFNTVRDVQATSPQLPGGPDAPQQLGGEIFGNILRRFAILETVSLVFILVALVLQASSPIWRGFWGLLRAALVILLIGVACYDHFHLTPTIWDERQAWRDAINKSPEDAALHHARFDLLHHQAEDLGHMKGYLLLALLLLVALRSAPSPKLPAITTPKSSP